MIYELFAATFATVTQTGRPNRINETLLDRIYLGQSVKINILQQSVQTNVRLNQVASVRKSVINLSTTSYLPHAQLAYPFGISQSVETHIGVTSVAIVAKPYTSNINLNQLATAEVSRPDAKTILNPTQSIILTRIYNLSTSTPLDIGHSCRVDYEEANFVPNRPQYIPPATGLVFDVVQNRYVEMPTTGLVFDPVTGYYTGTNSYGTVYTNGVVVPPVIKIKLTYNALNLNLELRPPEYGDIEELYHRKITRRSRGGDLIQYRDPAWSAYNRFSINILLLKRSEVDSLLQFLKESLGKAIIYKDYEGNEHSVFITNPDVEIVNETINYSTVRLELEEL